ncbi:hypothetical protein [Lysinibacillus sp. NPDC092081]|uniref:hypothetical protein n=1 Tax=Lysinibacillus sp. NPDC092081 TaxID=3364131 RepID=UPI003821B4D4
MKVIEAEEEIIRRYRFFRMTNFTADDDHFDIGGTMEELPALLGKINERLEQGIEMA